MLKIHSKRHIRCATVETPTAWLVVAVLLETKGNETVAVSEPRVVKVIPKAQQLALGGSKSTYSSAGYLLAAPAVLNSAISENILSPYVPNFGYAQSEIIMWLAAQPPTV